MKLRFCAALALLLWTLAPQASNATVVAGPIVNPANGHFYYLLAPTLWADAEAEAQTLGGHLVAILDDAENTWVWETFAALASGPFWIGLNDAAQEGVWVWTSGRDFDYANWWTAGGQPNNGGGIEHYVELNNYVWNDNTATPLFRAVVEVVPVGGRIVQVDWAAFVTGANGGGWLEGTFGTFEVYGEGQVFPLPAGASLRATAYGFSGAFPDGDYPLDIAAGGGLVLRFDSLDPIRTTLLSGSGGDFGSRSGTLRACGDGQCRVIVNTFDTAGYDQFRAARGTLSNGSYIEGYSDSDDPIFTYTVLPEPGALGAWVALTTVAVLRHRRRA